MTFQTRKRTDYIVVHCSATRPINRITVELLKQLHIARGFSDIGYHYFIDQDGLIHKGRQPDDCIGAHVQGHNANTVAVCLEGGLDNKTVKPVNNYTSKQFVALMQLSHILIEKYPNAKICGHRDFSIDANHDGIIEPYEYMKECPCFNAMDWAKGVNLPYATFTSEWKPFNDLINAHYKP